MNELEQARVAIDSIDAQLAALFEERMQVVKGVALYKQEQGLPVFHPEREKRVIEKNTERLHDEILKPYFKTFMQDLMDVSKKYQQDILQRK